MVANMQTTNRESLLLPDKITPYDNFELPPPPDASWLLTQVDDVTATPVGRKGRASNNRDINLQEDIDNSQFLHGSNDMDGDAMVAMDDDFVLELDFGDGMDGTVEMGRDAPAARGVDEDVLSEMDLVTRQKDGDNDTTLDPEGFGNDVRIADDGDVMMMDDDDVRFNLDDQSAMPGMAIPDFNRARISESPLSDIDEDLARMIEAEHTNNTDLYEPQDETETTIIRRPAQRAKKQRLMMPDEVTALSSLVIKQQQVDRQGIVKPASFLPRDPILMALMEMQKNGGFVSSIMMDRGSAWAPELRSMLSFENARGAHELKRKRDSGVADVESDAGAMKSPRLEIGDDTGFGLDAHQMDNQSVAADATIHDIPADEGIVPGPDDEDQDATIMPDFDDTAVPIVHPADSGPVSVGTTHAVHVLRNLFGADAAHDAEKRKKSSVVFQELLPEETTTKAEATKMFFECLVLATKDAIKVQQGDGLGDPIRVRARQGLWGAWAEREAGGEISAQNEPEPAAAAAPVVAVEA